MKQGPVLNMLDTRASCKIGHSIHAPEVFAPAITEVRTEDSYEGTGMGWQKRDRWKRSTEEVELAELRQPMAVF